MRNDLSAGYNSLTTPYDFFDDIFTSELLNHNGGNISQNELAELVDRLAKQLNTEFKAGNLEAKPDMKAFEALHEMSTYCTDLIRVRRFALQLTHGHVTGNDALINEAKNKIIRANILHDKHYSASDLPPTGLNIGIMARVVEASENHPGHRASLRKDSISLAQVYNEKVTRKGAYIGKKSGSSTKTPEQNIPSTSALQRAGSAMLKVSSRIGSAMKSFSEPS